MTAATTTKKKTARKPAKKVVKKAPTKKATTKKKAVIKKTPKGDSARVRVFKLLAKHDKNGLTATQIREKLELAGPPSLIKDECMSSSPRMQRGIVEGQRSVLYSLTAAGKKALKDETVDSKVPARTVGDSDLRSSK